ncbi:hypothetical protein CERZMDRAFT_116457 [Cercospora zeae-maydis SCOH1-5]|uniref:Zinc finger PHD-type domain-containing protein n=1 Tax=Cercospora zeae-maydis SCOH1-5 TaxID=717836 RepID=A0A6A6FSU6_9PEZI|nr:hypothetical protein CERZMDRAFT_116457 [Cercospora zeae-maydis SCOH1-5]
MGKGVGRERAQRHFAWWAAGFIGVKSTKREAMAEQTPHLHASPTEYSTMQMGRAWSDWWWCWRGHVGEREMQQHSNTAAIQEWMQGGRGGTAVIGRCHVSTPTCEEFIAASDMCCPDLALGNCRLAAVDWTFPSPGATPTSAAYTPNAFHTPKTASFPSHFHDAFATPQMATYTPIQPDFPDMHAAQRPHTAAPEVHRNTHLHMNPAQHAQAMPPPGPCLYQNFIMSPMYHHTSRPQTAAPVNESVTSDTAQMQTPPPTRGSSVKKPQLQEVAFGTPSTIASRRFASPQVVFQRPAQHPQMQLSPNMYQFGNFGPATAPGMPQVQLLWHQHGNPGGMQQQQPTLDDPFAPNASSSVQWSQNHLPQSVASPTAFDTPAMNSFSIQPATQRPATAVQLNYTADSVMTTTSVDPSLVYSSPIRPPLDFANETPKTKQTLQPSPLEPIPKPKGGRKTESKRAEHKRTDTTTTVASSSTASSSTLAAPRPVLQRSNTTGTARPQSVQSLSSAESLSRRNSVLHPPRTASPLKRVGRANLGSISENRKPRVPSVILTVDEFGRARAVRTDAPRENSPAKAMRERYPGLYDSDSSDEEEEGENDIPSRSTSFSFTKGQERTSKAAKLIPPIEGIDGLSIPRTSSAASMKVAPSRAAIAAAAQLRRGNSLRIRNPCRNGSLRGNNSALTSIDTAPMDMSSDRQSFIGSEDFNRGLTLSSGASSRRRSMMSSSSEHQPGVSSRFLPTTAGQAKRVRCLCGEDRENRERGPLVQCTSCTQYQHSSCVGGSQAGASRTCFLCTKPTTRLQVSNRRR